MLQLHYTAKSSPVAILDTHSVAACSVINDVPTGPSSPLHTHSTHIVVLPAPDTPMSAVSTLGLNEPVMLNSSCSWGWDSPAALRASYLRRARTGTYGS